jgi:predicted ferric reductase
MDTAPSIPKLGPDFSPALKFVSMDALATWLFYIVVMLVILYTLIAAYHWIRYGHRSVVTIPALAVHISVSLGLIGFALTGLP